MRQYMITYFVYRFGTQDYMKENLKATLAAIEQFQEQDIGVKLFAKVLANECEEEFHFEQELLQSQLMRQLKKFIQLKNKNMTELQLKSKVANIFNGNIEQWLWEKVIDKTLTAKDCDACADKLRQGKQVVSYQYFERVVLDF